MWGKFYFSSSSVVSRAFSGHVHAMRILDVWASSSSPRLPLRQILFLSRPHCCASLQRKIRYLITHSLSHSPSLFDMPGTEAYHFWITIKTVYYGTRKDGLTTSKFNWSTANISSSNPTISNLLSGGQREDATTADNSQNRQFVKTQGTVATRRFLKTIYGLKTYIHLWQAEHAAPHRSDRCPVVTTAVMALEKRTLSQGPSLDKQTTSDMWVVRLSWHQNAHSRPLLGSQFWPTK